VLRYQPGRTSCNTRSLFHASSTQADNENNNGIDKRVKADPDGDGYATAVLRNFVTVDGENTAGPEADTTNITGLRESGDCSVKDKASSFDPTIALLMVSSLN